MPDLIHRHAYSWTSDASGDASITIPQGQLNGTICRVTTIPSAVSGLVPTADYDVTLVDVDSIDLLQGQGADRSDTATEQFIPLLPFVVATVTVAYAPIAVDNAVTLVIANSGNVTSGKVIFHIKKG